ncbi:MAM domain, meprin/A5/mu domain-containing protein [Phthorimaea operculella]|nr:MAM domain, meprin/A5/mu domain-containing protein [Phthorimaea operculella]
MFWRSLLMLFVLSDIEGLSSELGLGRPTCLPHIDHGRYKVRIRQRGKLFKFQCFPTYRLVGSRYVTCRDDSWDAPLPVCVKSGCPVIPPITNGLKMPSHNGAWVVFFCYPGHQLVGSPAVYCDGRQWNGSIPACVDSTEASPLSCDFEDPNLCGWTQDELHDFDWRRLNKKTPSAFLFTGPPYDHTYGGVRNVSGYYMYIESTSRLENDTARLISPLYRSHLTKNGCFNFYYHMFGKTTGGLRVYQKPSTVPMESLHEMNDDGGQKYLLFEKWGNQGDVWYSGYSPLEDSDDDFQIVIEGIRGKSFTSDIAIDDVAILQGENCTAASEMATTPANTMPDSCAGRCDLPATPSRSDLECGCTAVCVINESCCPDFFDVCVFEVTPSAAELPQTQKLVLTTDKSSPPPPTMTKPTVPTSPPTTTIKITTTAQTTIKTTTIKPTTAPTTPKPTTSKRTTPAPVPTTKLIPTTKKIPPPTTKKVYTKPVDKPTTPKPTTPKARYTSTKRSTVGSLDMDTVQPIKGPTKSNPDQKKADKENSGKTMLLAKEDQKTTSSGLKTKI